MGYFLEWTWDGQVSFNDDSNNVNIARNGDIKYIPAMAGHI